MSALLGTTKKKDRVQLLKSLNNTNHVCLYRFFDEKWKAEALVSGKVWISTLEACRKYDNAAQGDADEGTLEYNSGITSGSGSNPMVQLVAKRSMIGGDLSACKNINISNITIRYQIPDAFVLCTAEKYSPDDMKDDFGGYCVKISQPNSFFRKVTRRLAEVQNLRYARINKVSYSKRSYIGTEPIHVPHIGFVKPNTDIYTSQNEVRMLWELAEHADIKPFVLNCPEIRKFCTLL
ncbi:hypothetical protein EI372_00495 [Vibrio fluvialis]|nr:hypothetical protein [Vibrio fluvialis]